MAPDWVGFNSHMTESRCLQVSGDATDALLRFAGADGEHMAFGRNFYTMETHIRHLPEVAGGEPVAVETRALGCDEKSRHLFHHMFHGERWGTSGGRPGTELATAEHMVLHADTAAARAAPEVAARLAKIVAAQAPLGVPEGAGRHIAMRKRVQDQFKAPQPWSARQ